MYVCICICIGLMLFWHSTSLNKVRLTQMTRRFAAACGSWLVSGSILLATPSAGDNIFRRPQDPQTFEDQFPPRSAPLLSWFVWFIHCPGLHILCSCACQFFQTDNDPRGTRGDSENQLVPLRTRTQNKAANTVVWDS